MGDKKEKTISIDREKEFQKIEEMKGKLLDIWKSKTGHSNWDTQDKKFAVKTAMAYANLLQTQMKLLPGNKPY